MQIIENTFRQWLSAALIVLLTGITASVTQLWTDYTNRDVNINGYVAPIDLSGFIRVSQEATLKVECERNYGSGFSFDFEEGDKAQFNFKWQSGNNSSIILTNYHVIQSCYENGSPVYLTDVAGNQLPGKILKVDIENDISAIEVSKQISPLFAIYYFNRPGYWNMAIGSPFGMSGSVTFGNNIYSEGYKLYTSASLNKGNSGGPLVDNTLYVMGINTGYKAVAQNLNFATDINALCEVIAKCYKEDGLLHPDVDEFDN